MIESGYFRVALLRFENYSRSTRLVLESKFELAKTKLHRLVSLIELLLLHQKIFNSFKNDVQVLAIERCACTCITAGKL